MNEEMLNTSVRKVLKKVGVTSQREIEEAVRAAATSLVSKSASPSNFRRITVEHWCRSSHLSIATGNLNDVVSGSIPDELSLPAPSGGTLGGSRAMPSSSIFLG
jgi:Family of unknown function (DUF6494)